MDFLEVGDNLIRHHFNDTPHQTTTVQWGTAMGRFVRKLVLAVAFAAVWVSFSWIPRSDVFVVRAFLEMLQALFGLQALHILAFQRSVR
jgi:hypothetical protein